MKALMLFLCIGILIAASLCLFVMEQQLLAILLGFPTGIMGAELIDETESA